MEFRGEQPIYQQIGDILCEDILRGVYKDGDKIPSIRELAVSMEVNPNTVLRTYNYLQDQEIIRNQRGIGYFISDGARELTMTIKKDDFIKRELPYIFKTMQLLSLDIEDLKEYYTEYINREEN